MFKNNKVVFSAILTALVIVLAIAAVALVSTNQVSAQEAPQGVRFSGLSDSSDGGFSHRRDGMRPDGFHGPNGGDPSYLAAELGISVEELEAAQSAAWEKALGQAVLDGTLTEEQAASLAEKVFGAMPFEGRRGFDHESKSSPLNVQEFLAEELGISVEELESAQQAAADAAIQAAIESGELDPEVAELMQAKQAVRDYIDPQAMTASALGISVEALQTAQDEGKTMQELIDESGLTPEEFRDAMQDAYASALESAVADGVISEAQMELLLNSDRLGPMGGFPGGPGQRPFGRGGRGVEDGFAPLPCPGETPVPNSSS